MYTRDRLDTATSAPVASAVGTTERSHSHVVSRRAGARLGKAVTRAAAARYCSPNWVAVSSSGAGKWRCFAPSSRLLKSDSPAERANQEAASAATRSALSGPNPGLPLSAAADSARRWRRYHCSSWGRGARVGARRARLPRARGAARRGDGAEGRAAARLQRRGGHALQPSAR